MSTVYQQWEIPSSLERVATSEAEWGEALDQMLPKFGGWTRQYMERCISAVQNHTDSLEKS
jgi:hypothetical protein